MSAVNQRKIKILLLNGDYLKLNGRLQTLISCDASESLEKNCWARV